VPENFRRCHWLSKNRLSKRPDTILFFDTEAYIDDSSSYRQEHTYRLGAGSFCTYSPVDGLLEQQRKILPTALDLWAWVEILALKHSKLLLISHNIDYDARVAGAFRYLPQNGWTPGWCVMSPSCTVFGFVRGDQKLTLLDGLNLFPMSLADMGESVGIPKTDVDFAQVSTRELAEYCENDVQILVAAWKRWFDFLDTHNMGNFGITIAGQAFNAYRHHFMPCKIGIHGHLEANELERAAYRGGRVECFYVGDFPKGTYYKLDVNGLYTAMMDAHLYPKRLVKVIENVEPEELQHLLKTYLVVAEVILDTDESRYPVTVVGRVAYPVGSFVTTLTTPEVKTALRNGHIVGIGRVALYEPADLFSEYVQYLSALRNTYQDQNDYASSKMAKLMVNALQGKFGQRGHKQKVIGDAPIGEVNVRRWVDGETGATAVDWTFGGAIIRQWTEGESFDSFPAIPAHVCAYGRDHMQALFERAGRGNVFYTDTDSLIVNEEGYQRLQDQIFDDVPGLLKVEGTATDVTIRARKDYRFGDLEVIKGIRDTAKPIAPNVYEQWHWTTLRYAFISERLEGVTLHKVRKELKRGSVAGQIRRDGWVDPPLVAMSPADLEKLAPVAPDGKRWTWQVEASFSRSVRESQSRRWALGAWVKWAKPLRPQRPSQPLSAGSDAKPPVVFPVVSWDPSLIPF